MTADATRDYLDAISRYPLLSTQQEIQLARKIAQYMELRDKPDPTPAAGTVTPAPATATPVASPDKK